MCSSENLTHNVMIASTASYRCVNGKTMIIGVHVKYNNDDHFAIDWKEWVKF